jgi:hypothetical protein
VFPVLIVGMVEPPPAGTVEAKSADAWRWGRSAAAAAWPLSCALVLAAYALFPERFPENAGPTLMVLVAVESPTLLLGVLYATALAEPTVAARLKLFFVGVLVLALMAGLHLGVDVDLAVVAPLLFLALLPYVVDLSSHHADPALASRQAAAVLEDRLHMIALIPVVLLYGVVLGIMTVVLLAGLSVALGSDLVGELGNAVGGADPSLLALLGSAYLLVGAASAAHVHRPVFLRDRKALLDRAWIHKASLRKG